MRKLIILTLCLGLLASCVTQKRCFEKFPPQVIIKDSLVIKDTTVYVKVRDTIPGDSVVLHDTIPCPIEYHKEKKSTSGRTTVKVDISGGKLTVDCNTDSLIRANDSLAVKVKTLESYKSEVKIVEKPVVKNRIPAWILIYSILLTIGVIGYITLRVKKVLGI